MKLFKLVLGCMAIVLAAQAAPKAAKQKKQITIILDLGGVAFNTSKLTAAKQIGGALMYGGIRQREVVFEHLASLLAYDTTEAQPVDETGRRLPDCYNAYFKGTITSTELRALIAQSLTNTCLSKPKRNLISATTNFMFTPESLIKSQKLDDDCLQAVRQWKCCNGYKLIILSNWDKESFALIEKQHPEFFSLFDGMVVSGRVGLSKPDPKIYQYLLDTYELDPYYCIFIDDQETNIKAGQSLGMRGIVKNKSFKKIRKEVAQIACEKLSGVMIATA